MAVRQPLATAVTGLGIMTRRTLTVQAPDEFSSAAQWADAYRELGLAVIPARGQEKIPLGKWQEFQNGIPQAVHDRWYGDNGDNRTNYRMGFLTGAASIGEGWKLLLIDLDEKGAVSGSATWDQWIGENELGCDPETWRARTGGGGQHIYFKYPAHLHIRNTQETIAGIDVRAEGGFVITPPSRHVSGRQYTWLYSPFETDLAEAPDWLLGKVGASTAPFQSAPTVREKASSPEQSTDAWGHIIDGRDAYMRDMIWAAVVDWHRECPIPPTEHEIERKALEAYAVYERKVRPQDPSRTLEDEGRGIAAFRAKWAYAMRQWDGKVAEAAKVPGAVKAPSYDFSAAQATISSIKTTDFMTLLTEEVIEEPDYIEPGFAGPGNFVLVAGPPKAQKSFLLQEMLVAAACGDSFLAGTFNVPNPLRIFYLQAEMNRKLLRKRAREMKFLTAEQKALLAQNFVVSERFHMILNDGGVEAAATAIQKAFPDHPPDIIAIDPLANVFDQENENDNTQIMRFLTSRVEAVRQKVNPLACIVLVHHATKKGVEDLARDPFVAIRGGGALRGYYDSAIVIYRASEEGSARKVHFELRGAESPEPITVELVNGRFVKSDPLGGIDKTVARKILSEIDQAWRSGSPWSLSGKSKSEGRNLGENACRLFGIPASAAESLAKAWMANGVVVHRERVFRKHPAGLEVVGSID